VSSRPDRSHGLNERKDQVTGTTSQSGGDAQSDRNPEADSDSEANNDPRSSVERAKAREREMEESGQENAA